MWRGGRRGNREEGCRRQGRRVAEAGGRLEAIKRWRDVLKNMTKKIIKH